MQHNQTTTRSKSSSRPVVLFSLILPGFHLPHCRHVCFRTPFTHNQIILPSPPLFCQSRVPAGVNAMSWRQAHGRQTISTSFNLFLFFSSSISHSHAHLSLPVSLPNPFHHRDLSQPSFTSSIHVVGVNSLDETPLARVPHCTTRQLFSLKTT